MCQPSLREECGALRDELAHRHKEDMVCALAELSTLKDRAMRDAVTLWNDERNKLMDQVSSLKWGSGCVGGGGGGEKEEEEHLRLLCYRWHLLRKNWTAFSAKRNSPLRT